MTAYCPLYCEEIYVQYTYQQLDDNKLKTYEAIPAIQIKI